jgi:hypothetical protein
LGLATPTGLIAVLTALTGFVLLLLAGPLSPALLLAGFIGVALVLPTRTLLTCFPEQRTTRDVPLSSSRCE